ncbi:MAG: hypothetical protein AB1349_04680 [Elusimicrobiota bacterium]
MNIEQLLKLLKEHNVKFLVIGAEAFPAYGYARATFDIDIFIEPIEENAKKAIKALKEFGYDIIEDTTLENFLTKKTLIRQYVLPTDIHPFVTGINFKEVWKNKIRAKIGDTYVYFPALKDMIKMKKAAGRVKDKEDLKYLTAILKRKKKK